jgi:excisionase family DNA binding protein
MASSLAGGFLRDCIRNRRQAGDSNKAARVWADGGQTRVWGRGDEELIRERLTRAGPTFTGLRAATNTFARKPGLKRQPSGAEDVAAFLRDADGMPRSVLVDQAAAMLGLSRRTVYYRIRAGKLTTLRTRCGSQRVLMASIERLLEEMGQKEVSGTKAAAEDLAGTDDLTIGQDAGV